MSIEIRAVRNIVVDYLIKNGYEGLVEPDGECGCGLDDLFTCDSENIEGCQPGYKIPCNCGEGCNFHIVTVKPEVKFNGD